MNLLNFPDTGGSRTAQLVPEAAARLPRVSPDGRTYVFVVNAGFTRFSNGERVTAQSFKRAIDRLALGGPNELVRDIVGADDVITRKASSVSGVVLRGSELHISLTAPRRRVPPPRRSAPFLRPF